MNNETSLTAIPEGTLGVEKARLALALCVDVDEAKEIHSKALAVRIYMRSKAAGMQAVNDATEIMLVAERRMGMLLTRTEKNKGGRPALETTTDPKEEVVTLGEMGITHKLAARSQKFAEIEEGEFNDRIRDARESDSLTIAAVMGKKKSPGTQDMRTPQWLFDELSEKFGKFQLDAYASDENHLCPRYYTKQMDSNSLPWLQGTFANPEFAHMEPATRKAVEEWDNRGVKTIMLSPVGCSQNWYHEWAIRGTIWVPNKRINFDTPNGAPTNSADRDTIVIAFGGEHANKRYREGEFRVRALNLKGPKK